MDREVYAAHARTAAYGEKGERFMDAEKLVNVDPTFGHHLTSKSLQDRYKLIQDNFDKKYVREQHMSGVGRETG